MNSKIVREINKIGGEVYLVGGSVRDQFLGVESKDQDYVVTGVRVNPLKRVLYKFGTAKLVGESFGVLKFRPHGSKEEIDVALPRTERSTGDGHCDFEVKVDHDLPIEDDLGRRDFTMNAMAIKIVADAEKELIDPFGGQEDIKKKVIKMVFPQAFEEDPLRMLRAVQFAARFKFKLEKGTEDAIQRNAAKMETISGERIFEEIKKVMLRAEFPSIAFKLSLKTGLLKYFFPELEACIGVSQPAKWHDLDVFNHILYAVDSVLSVKLNVRLAALFHDIAKPQTRTDDDGEIHFLQHEFAATPVIKEVLGRWKAPKDLTEEVVLLVRSHMFALDFDISKRATRRLIKRVTPELIYDLIDLRVGDRIACGKSFLSFGKVGRFRQQVADELAEPAFNVSHLAIGGKDLIELGLEPGPLFRKILDKVLEKVMEDEVENEREELLVLARGIVDAEV